MDINVKLSVDTFKKYICNNVCKVCVPKDVAFCMFLANADPQGFTDFLLYVNILFETNNSLRFELNSFEAFSGIICDYLCRFKTDECVPHGNQLKCYEIFINRCGTNLTTKMKSSILERYSGIPQLQIGIDFEIYDLDRLISSLKVKTRKKLIKRVRKAMKKIGFTNLSNAIQVNTNETINKSNNKSEKDVCHTSIFFNKNELWENKLNEIWNCI